MEKTTEERKRKRERALDFISSFHLSFILVMAKSMFDTGNKQLVVLVVVVIVVVREQRKKKSHSNNNALLKESSSTVTLIE